MTNKPSISERATAIAKHFDSHPEATFECDLAIEGLRSDTLAEIERLQVEQSKRGLNDWTSWNSLDELILSYREIIFALEGLRKKLVERILLN